MPKIELRLATKPEHETLMALLNDVFFREPEGPRDFLSLLPKLYKKSYAPWAHNYCLWEDGVLKAAVGMYVSDIDIAGTQLRVGGIGNVAVSRDSRGKGYMQATMQAAMDAMRAAGCVFGVLGGQRQRYQNWGFEVGGTCCRAQFCKRNLQHTAPAALQARPLSPTEVPQAQALLEAQPIHVRHRANTLLDVLRSWRETPCGIWEGDTLAALAALHHSKDGVNIWHVRDSAQLCGVVRAAFTLLAQDLPVRHCAVGLEIPAWEPNLLAAAEEVAESVGVGTTGMYAILDWDAFLAAMAPFGTLPPPPAHLTQLQKIRYYLAPVTTLRPAHLQPLPLLIKSYDDV
ncbi:MAG: GNAT family N-acetyltransferase [Oscillospiraceae bacterium]|jgi:predicted N-acetyltransferase YhbS|nr:GNAT family N-acetyltransferase [Oscillospiraceae bacterium]